MGGVPNVQTSGRFISTSELKPIGVGVQRGAALLVSDRATHLDFLVHSSRLKCFEG
jgi:hypothetical protein